MPSSSSKARFQHSKLTGSESTTTPSKSRISIWRSWFITVCVLSGFLCQRCGEGFRHLPVFQYLPPQVDQRLKQVALRMVGFPRLLVLIVNHMNARPLPELRQVEPHVLQRVVD